MNFPPRFALLLDGAFVVKKLQERSRARTFPDADAIEVECNRIRGHNQLSQLELLRVYFYHARPATDTITNPLSRQTTNLATTGIYRQHESLLDRLEMKPDFALRLGETVAYDWKIGDRAMKSMLQTPRAVTPQDLVPDIQQKGVDLRIGLDIARLSLRQVVSHLVVVTGDSDLVPAFRFARREGLRIYLDHLGHGVRRDLKAHVDRIL